MRKKIEAVGVPVWTIVANELSVAMVSVVVSIEVVLVLVGSSKKEKKSISLVGYMESKGVA